MLIIKSFEYAIKLFSHIFIDFSVDSDIKFPKANIDIDVIVSLL